MSRLFSFASCLVIAILSGYSLGTASYHGQDGLNSDSQVYLPLVLSMTRPPPRVNIPYFESGISFPETAIIWFGRVDLTSNYADVRIGYNDAELALRLAVFDRRLWYDPSASSADLSAYDGASLYLYLDGPDESSTMTNSYRLVSQLNWWEPRERWQASYQLDASGWVTAEIPFTTARNWKGNAPNDGVDDRGWIMTIRVPFASLGLNGPPSQGTEWGLAIVLHDRDDQAGTPVADLAWPPSASSGQLSEAGVLVFGLPNSSPPAANRAGSVVIRHGLAGAAVTDAHVGGHANCGRAYRPDYFSGWGEANYAGYDQINIQNQYDVSDWPCFSKFYITFPLDLVPEGKVLLDANLTLYQSGNAGMGWEPPPEPSLIQVSTILEDWDENTITWNNAPLAHENVAQTWVDPIDSIPNGPGVKNQWDLTAAASRAYRLRQPLRLVLYSADNAYHSGKYFFSSDSDGWDGLGRPTLTITWGEP